MDKDVVFKLILDISKLSEISHLITTGPDFYQQVSITNSSPYKT